MFKFWSQLVTILGLPYMECNNLLRIYHVYHWILLIFLFLYYLVNISYQKLHFHKTLNPLHYKALSWLWLLPKRLWNQFKPKEFRHLLWVSEHDLQGYLFPKKNCWISGHSQIMWPLTSKYQKLDINIYKSETCFINRND